MSSITRVLHTTTWDYFTEHLAFRFTHSPKVVREEIMADINDLVQEARMSSRDGAVGESFVATCRLFEIFQVCFDFVPFFSTAVNLADKNLQNLIKDTSTPFISELLRPLDEEFIDRFKIMFDGYRKMIDQSFSKSKDLGDILRFLPGVVVQRGLSMEGMTVLYRIKAERLIKLTFQVVEVSYDDISHYKLNGYLSDLLQDRDRSQLYYRDPELQHISICRQLLSLLDRCHDLDLMQEYVFRLI